eukprot:GHVU01073355.1.p1 GENE.GHVU01073355.1~~GHVU01073355.1.p1  ORF type:complete len:140 (-),score=4.75 GHVU01073355.1:524-943(-)
MHRLFVMKPQARRSGLSLAMQGTGNRSASCSEHDAHTALLRSHIYMHVYRDGWTGRSVGERAVNDPSSCLATVASKLQIHGNRSLAVRRKSDVMRTPLLTHPRIMSGKYECVCVCMCVRREARWIVDGVPTDGSGWVGT